MNNSNLEKEFVAVISDITKGVTDNVVKKTALKSMEKLNDNISTLQKEYASLLRDVENHKKTYRGEMETLRQDLTQIRRSYTEENQALLKEIQSARSNYKTSAELLTEDIKKSKAVLDNSDAEIKAVLNHLDHLVATWDSAMEENAAKISQLSKRVETLQAELRDETGKLRSLHDAGVTELQSAIDAARASSENGAAALHEECQSLAGAFSQGNNSLIQMLSRNQEAVTEHLASVKQEYDKKYKMLLAVTAANLLGIAFFLWRIIR